MSLKKAESLKAVSGCFVLFGFLSICANKQTTTSFSFPRRHTLILTKEDNTKTKEEKGGKFKEETDPFEEKTFCFNVF